MRDFLTLALVMLTVFIGLPCLALGAAGLLGSLADASYSDNVHFAFPYLVVAITILVPATLWISARIAQRYQEPPSKSNGQRTKR